MSEPLAEKIKTTHSRRVCRAEAFGGRGAVLRKMIDAGRISSFILWGPPGVGRDHVGADHSQ